MSGTSDLTVQVANLTTTAEAVRTQLRNIVNVAAAASSSNVFLTDLYTSLRS